MKIQITFDGGNELDISLEEQQVSELVAAISLGNRRINSETARLFAGSLRDEYPSEHYLYLREPPGSRPKQTVVACGMSRGLDDMIEEDGRVAYLYKYPRETCPNCRESGGEEDDESDSTR